MIMGKEMDSMGSAPFTARLKTLLKRCRHLLGSLPYRGRGRWCPVCDKNSRKFRSYGRVRRTEARCIHCGSLERHRFLWLYFQRETNLFDGTSKRMLHIAPEPCFIQRLKEQLGSGYLTADLGNPSAMVKMDVTDIRYPDESFDVIYCSHVLEHVKEDRKAVQELFRVLKKGGWAIVIVPITSEKTFEDETIVDDEGRLRAYGSPRHVRRYGEDFIDRLRDAGFLPQAIRVSDLFGDHDVRRMGLVPSSRLLYYCRKA